MSRTLTLKQLKFTKAYINNGGNGTQAALEAYDTNPQSARQIASDNLTKPDIRQTIEKALTENGLTPHEITKEIKDIATRSVEKVSADTKLRASIELLKLWGAYPGSKHTNLNLSIKGDVNKMSYKDAKETLKKLRETNSGLLQDTEQDTTDIVSPNDVEQ